MPNPSFERITRQLLDAGITPRLARRLRAELEDHYRDLECEALTYESAPGRAAREARRRLGADAVIVREFLRRPELRSWIYRSSALTWVLRTVTRVYLWSRPLWLATAPWRAPIARYAAAAALALVVTGGTLLVLEASLRASLPLTNEPRQLVTAVPVPEARETGVVPAPRVHYDNEVVVRPGDSWPDYVYLPAEQRPASPILDPWRQVSDSLALEPPEPELFAGVERTSFAVAHGELTPIMRVAPRFPAFAARRGIEGYVVIEYTVTSTGTVRDVVVIESSDSLFEGPAVNAISKFLYRPRVVDGKAVAVRGVRTRMRFVLEA